MPRHEGLSATKDREDVNRLRAFLSQPVPYWWVLAWAAVSTVGVLIVWWTR